MCRHSGYLLPLLLSELLSSEPYQPPSCFANSIKVYRHTPPLTSCACWASQSVWWRGCCYPWARNTRLRPENTKQNLISHKMLSTVSRPSCHCNRRWRQSPCLRLWRSQRTHQKNQKWRGWGRVSDWCLAALSAGFASLAPTLSVPLWFI